MAAAIDRYVYITLHDTFEPVFIIKYSRLERVEAVRAIEHPIVREALLMAGFESGPGLEVTSMADIPAGTGLGSSGSFTTALLKGLYAHRRNPIHPAALAEAACEIEMVRLQEPVGKQDPYIAACGGRSPVFVSVPAEKLTPGHCGFPRKRSTISKTISCCSLPVIRVPLRRFCRTRTAAHAPAIQKWCAVWTPSKNWPS